MAWFLFFIIDFLGKGYIFVTLQGTLIVTMMVMLPLLALPGMSTLLSA